MSWKISKVYTLDDLIIHEVLISNPCCVGKLYKYIEHPDGSMTLDGDIVGDGVKKWIRDERKTLNERTK